MFSEFMESDKETDGVMAPCAGKAQKERDVRSELGVIAGQLEQGEAEVIFFQVAVPAPGSIRVREMAQVFRGAGPVVPTGAGVGVYGGAVTGDGKAFLRDKAAFDGWKDGGMVKEELQARLKVKRDIFPFQEPFFDRFRDFGSGLLCFLVFAFGLVGLFGVPGSGEQLVPGIQVRCRGSPKPVHEVKIGTKRGQGIRSASNECGEETVAAEPVNPKGKGGLGKAFGRKEEEKDKRP